MPKRPTWEKSEAATPPKAVYQLTSLDRLHAAMLAKGYTSGLQLARAAGLGPSTVNHIVHGRRHKATPKTVHHLREALGPDVDQLFALEKSAVHANQVRTAA